MQLVTEVKKQSFLKGETSPKRRKSPERQVDLTRVLDTIPDKNENQSIKNSTNDNYFSG